MSVLEIAEGQILDHLVKAESLTGTAGLEGGNGVDESLTSFARLGHDAQQSGQWDAEQPGQPSGAADEWSSRVASGQ